MTPRARVGAGLSAAVLALAVPLIVHFEGNVPRTYRDPVGIRTACVGHTGPELRDGQTFTADECREMLDGDLAEHAAGMLLCVREPLSDGEYAAYLSFTFNVGVGAFCGSTLVAKLNSGDHQGACAELSRWTRSAGRELPGLVRRRVAERRLCESTL